MLKEKMWMHFRLAIKSDKEIPWEHQEKAVYTVASLQKEMKERLSPPSDTES